MQLDPLGAVAVVDCRVVLCPAALCWGVPSLAGLAGFTFCARGAGSERGEPGRNDRRRVQSVLWGGAPAPVGLMPSPGGAAAIVWRWVRGVVIVAGVVLCCYP